MSGFVIGMIASMMNMVMFIMTGDVPSLIAGMACLAIGLICAAADA